MYLQDLSSRRKFFGVCFASKIYFFLTCLCNICLISNDNIVKLRPFFFFFFIFSSGISLFIPCSSSLHWYHTQSQQQNLHFHSFLAAKASWFFIFFDFDFEKKQGKHPIFFSESESSGPSSLVVGGSDFFSSSLSAMVDCGEEVLLTCFCQCLPLTNCIRQRGQIFLIQKYFFADIFMNCLCIVKLRQGSGKDQQGMAVKAKGLKA